jgi:TRAP-type C4-dicarboxylate transport system permease large subunit
VVAPLIIPLGQVFGIDPVHLGIIFIANLELGFITPPVGLNLFLASYRFEMPLLTLYRNVFPFFLVQFAIVLVITYVPDLTLWLTHVIHLSIS